MRRLFVMFPLCIYVLIGRVQAIEPHKSYVKSVAAFAQRVDSRVLRIVDKALHATDHDPDTISLLNEITTNGLDADPEPVIDTHTDNWSAWQDWAVRHKKMRTPTDRDQRRPIKDGIKSEPQE